MRIAQLTSVHPRYDTRIFLKQCRSLQEAGHEVSLVVADGKGDEIRDGVRVFDVGASTGRLDRMWTATRRVLKKARELDADIYHLHDPELIPAGLSLRARGKIVIFDAHEDLPKQILSKPYLSPWVRRPLALAMAGFEGVAFPRFSGVVGATPAITEKLSRSSSFAELVNNYPLPGELENIEDGIPKENEVCYVGGISSIRGAAQIVRALSLVRNATRLNLAGPIAEKGLRSSLQQEAGWSSVNELGLIGRGEVRDVMARSIAGLVTFLPAPNHMEAQPNKMFEYMSAGLPVIASNFPLWRTIIEDVGCGICVDPEKPEQIAEAIDRIADDPVEARLMGQRGKEAVAGKYNWPSEADKLLNFYKKLLVS
jgi:glycosyltransferase involved in cell wall biosynthesis